MRDVPGGSFTIGSERFYSEEAPTAWVTVPPFAIDVAPVTNANFAAFVAETSYVTLAELAPDPADYPGMPPELAQPGSLVFDPTASSPEREDPHSWWRFVVGADWRHPYGPYSSIKGLDDHPVVHVAHGDAAAFAQWAGKALPTEVEWEYAARGGLKGCDYAWGSDPAPDGMIMANIWQGPFPDHNLCLDGWERTSPVGAFPANGFGLLDMIGNVWEWTADPWSLRTKKGREGLSACCTPLSNQSAQAEPTSHTGQACLERMVLKGGSHLCADSYCHRYRPAARIPQAVDTSTSHIGFRCVMRGH